MNKKSSFSSDNCTNDEDIYKKIKKVIVTNIYNVWGQQAQPAQQVQQGLVEF